MHGLMIEAAMINPRGKIDRLNQQVSQELLNREWIQIRNSTGTTVTLDGIELIHLVYGSGESTRESTILQLKGLLPAQAGLRIHSGRGTTSYDSERQVFHGFANTQSDHFLYQVVKPDRIMLRKGRTLIDAVRYEVPVPESRRLKRVLPLERQLLQAV